jgi:hypothetical protein
MARTVVDIPNKGESLSHATLICGASAAFSFSVTTNAGTTAVIPLSGLIPWRIINEGDSSVTLTFFDALTEDGTALTTYDEDNAEIPAVVVADSSSRALPSGLAGCTFLVVTGSGAASDLTLVCKR